MFRGRRGDIIKCLWFDGVGLCLFAKRLERGRFVWSKAEGGTVSLSRPQQSMLLEGIDWRRPERTFDVPAAVWAVVIAAWSILSALAMELAGTRSGESHGLCLL